MKKYKAKKPVAKAKPVAKVKPKPHLKPKKTEPPAKAKTVVNRIRELVVAPATPSHDPLITPLPQKEVRNFGEMPFNSQASLVFNTFPANEAEIIGSTANSGAGTVATPKFHT